MKYLEFSSKFLHTKHTILYIFETLETELIKESLGASPLGLGPMRWQKAPPISPTLGNNQCKHHFFDSYQIYLELDG